MMFEFAEESRRLTDIRVAGIGGAGGNAVDRMIHSGLVGVEFLALNTDLQALGDSRAHQNLQIGAQLTHGLGSGGKPEIGQGAAEEDRDTIGQALAGANMVFVTAGMGGGTGTGAAPVVAEIARQQGALTVGIVTKPFVFEGRVRQQQAEEGIRRMREVVDTLIVVPNQRLLEIAPPSTSMDEAFLIADQVLYEATRGIYEIISRHDTLNLDFADVCSVMRGMGVALMGTGRADGEGRALRAAQDAIQSPLLENLDIQGSKAVLVNVLGGEVGLHDTAEAMQFIQEAAGPEAHVIFGYGVDESLGDTLQVTVIATGFQALESAGGSLAVTTDPVQVLAEAKTGSPVAVTPESDAAFSPEAETAAVPDTPDIFDEEEILAAAEQEEPVADEDLAAYGVYEQEADPGSEPEMVSVLDEDCPAPPQEPPCASGLDVMTVPEMPRDIEEPVAVTLPDPGPLAPPEAEPEFEDEIEAAADAGHAAETAPEREVSEAPPVFLERAAASGGGEEDSSAPAAPTGDPISRFLRPAGRRNIGEVEVPAVDQGPVPISRSTAAGLGPEKPGEDRATPAYIRKYMD